MDRFHPPLRALAIAATGAVACTGCAMLGSLFEAPVLRGIVAVVVVVAAIGFLVSRSAPRR